MEETLSQLIEKHGLRTVLNTIADIAEQHYMLVKPLTYGEVSTVGMTDIEPIDLMLIADNLRKYIHSNPKPTMTFFTTFPKQVCTRFIDECFPFKAEPYPYNYWRFDVKDERPRLIANFPKGCVLTQDEMDERVAAIETGDQA